MTRSDWKLAGGLIRLREQLNAGSPARSIASDGTIGNAEHAARESDHNPWWVYGGVPYVTAIDITHDPARLNCDRLETALARGGDPRIKYLIWDHHIIAGDAGPSPWVWREYRGADPHTGHLHLSVMPKPSSLLQADWNLTGLFTEDDVRADEVWGFPVHDLYTPGESDTMTAGVALEWATRHAALANESAQAALSTVQRVEAQVLATQKMILDLAAHMGADR